jgi:exportin-2 (importin alpha re-exporter)
MIDALLSRIESARTPEKVAENDHLIKCDSTLCTFDVITLANLVFGLGVMRIIVTARGSLTPTFERTLGRLVGILGVISKNPSNPHFDQYIFESLSGLMRSGPSIARPTACCLNLFQIYCRCLPSIVANI